MVVTIFRSRLRQDAGDDYGLTAARMVELATAMPGFVSHKRFTADDGERLTMVEFDSHETLRAWRMHPEHRDAQHKGRANYYDEYILQTCEVVRESRWRRAAEIEAAAGLVF